MPPTVSAVHADNGYETTITIRGAEPGRNNAQVRIFPTVPSGDRFDREWEGPEHSFTINGLAERGIATIADKEIRFDVKTPKGMTLRLPVAPGDVLVATEQEPSGYTSPIPKRVAARGLLSEGKS